MASYLLPSFRNYSVPCDAQPYQRLIADDLGKCASAANWLLTSAFVARQTAACSILRISLHLLFDREFCDCKKAAPRLKKYRFRSLSASQPAFFSAAKMRHHRYPLRGCFGAQLVSRLRRHFLLLAKKPKQRLLTSATLRAFCVQKPRYRRSKRLLSRLFISKICGFLRIC